MRCAVPALYALAQALLLCLIVDLVRWCGLDPFEVVDRVVHHFYDNQIYSIGVLNRWVEAQMGLGLCLSLALFAIDLVIYWVGPDEEDEDEDEDEEYAYEVVDADHPHPRRLYYRGLCLVPRPR